MKRAILLLWIILTALPTIGSAKVKRLSDVVYGHCDGAALVMDVLVPEHQNGIAVFRMVSGGWVSFDAAACDERDYKVFTDRGMTVFLVSHGSQPRYKVHEIIGQIQRAIRFVRHHCDDFGVDPQRFCTTGISSGGHLSIAAGVFGTDAVDEAQYREMHETAPEQAIDPVELESSRVQAVACFFPPVDLMDFSGPGETFADFPIDSIFVPAFFDIRKTPREEQLRILEESSPYQHIDRQTPPILVFHGTTDQLVPFSQAPRLMERLKEMGIPHKLIVVEGYGHGWPYRKSDDIEMARWFETYTKKTKR